MTVSGVLSSCETLAMKSRRIFATASIRVMSRVISSFSATPNGTIWMASVTPASRCDSMTMGSVKSPASI